MRHVVDHDDAVRAAVVSACDRAKSFLARRVPDLELDRLAVDHNCFKAEVDADRRDITLSKLIVRKACAGTKC